MRQLGHRALVLGAALALLLLMDHVYLSQFALLFPGVGFPVRHRVVEFQVVGWVLALFPTLFLPLRIHRPSQVLAWTAYLMIALPTAGVGAHSVLGDGAYLAMTLTVVAGTCLLAGAGVMPTVRVPQLHLSASLYWSLLGVLIVFCYAVLYRQYGAILQLADWKQIYTQRLIWMQAGAGLLAGYSQSWLANAINPFLMAYGIGQRRWWVFGVGAVLEAVLFLIAAQRSMLVAPLLLVGVYLLLRDGGRRFGEKLTVGAALLWVIPTLVFLGTGLWDRAIAEIAYYRTFVNNGLLSAYYFDFFSTHPQVHFSAVKGLSAVFSSPYAINYKEALSWHFFGYASDPNAHVFADGFAQFGYAGSIIEGLMLAASLWLLDCVAATKRLPLAFVGVAAAMQVNNVANGQMPNFLTGEGFLALLALLYLMPYGNRNHRHDVASAPDLMPTGGPG